MKRRKLILIFILFIILAALINRNVYAAVQESFLSSQKYEIRDKKILRVLANTRVSEFKKNILATEGDRVYVSNGNNSTDSSFVKTGANVYVNTTQYTVYVRGDVNGDGRVTVTDLSITKLYITEKDTNVKYVDAMDMNYDGKITVTDIALLKMFLVGKNLPETYVTSVEGDIVISKSTNEFVESVDISVKWPENTNGLIKRISLDNGKTTLNYYNTVRMNKNSTVIASLINYKGDVLKTASLEIENIDTKAPYNFDLSYEHKINNQIIISGETKDDLSGIKGYFYSINDGTTWENTNIYNEVKNNSTVYIKMKALDMLEHTTETVSVKQNTFSTAMEILDLKLYDVKVDISNNTVELMDGRKFQVLKNNSGSYDVTYLGSENIEESKYIIEKIKLELENGFKGEILNWMINNKETTEENVDRKEGTFVNKNNENKRIIINFEDGTYRIEDYNKTSIDMSYTLTPEFPILTNQVVLNITGKSDNNIDTVRVVSNNSVLSEYKYGNNIKEVDEYILLPNNGKYTIEMLAKDGETITKDIYIANISNILPIEFSIIPNTSRNTLSTGTQNGIATGSISLNAEFENVDFYYKDRFQYQIGEMHGQWTACTGAFTLNDIKVNQFIFTRYFDGNKIRKVNVIPIQNVDNEKPLEFQFDIQPSSNSIKVIGNAIDKGSYMEASKYMGILGYKFRINDGEWTAIQNSGEYTFENLIKNTEYKIEMLAIDYAGNETVATNSGKVFKTTVVPYLNNGIKYTLNPSGMTNKDVSINIEINPIYSVEYRVDETAEWTASKVLTVSKNTIIYVRAKDSTNQIGDTGTINILNIDKLAPKLSQINIVNYTSDNKYKFAVKGIDADSTGEYSNSGVAKYEVYSGTTMLGKIDSFEESDALDIDSELLKNNMEIYVRTYDLAGNYKDSEKIKLVLMEETPLKNIASVGDYIAYNAGVWNEKEMSDIKANNTRLTLPNKAETFGGFQVGDSRNGNALPWQNIYSAKSDGWKVWNIEDENVQIISAGCPEDYYHAQGRTYASEMVLTGTASNTTDALPRDFSMYVDEKYANSAKCLTKLMFDTWYNKNIDSSVLNTWGVALKTIEENSKMDIIANGAGYWLATGRDEHLYYFAPDLNKLMIFNNTAMGIRLVVDLKEELNAVGYIIQNNENGNSVKYWIIK